MSTKSIFDGFLRIFTSLQKGKQLNNPEFWKHVNQTINFIALIAPGVMAVVPQYSMFLTKEFLTACLTLSAGASAYFNAATTQKIGL